ncbi:AMP-binding protein [Streptomyces sp. NPDC048182]|uniref:non-ribosomal peptide synthetase n=1 Tax=Streptomyces sp. NPDC048182 TaxID=3365507 RepID=UPI00371CC762
MTESTILSTWARQVVRLGPACALDTADGPVGYADLAARVAGYEARLTTGGSPAPPVLLMSADPVEVIAAMLGCMAAGRTFAPVSVATPAAVLAGILDALRPGTAVVDAAHVDVLHDVRHAATAAAPVETLCPQDVVSGDASADRWADATVADHGYVCFTSGTTGRPKGIRGSLRAVRHFVDWERTEFGVGTGTRVSQLTSPGFDAFLRDAFVPLCAGGTVCVPPGATPPVGDGLARWLAAARVEIAHCVPTVFRTLRAARDVADRLPALRAVLLAGEPLHAADVAWWRGSFGDRAALVNLYGPSETTMTKFFRRTTADDAHARPVPVGRPLPGVSFRVLGAGGIGEIEIETPFPLPGYLGDEPGGFDADGRRFRTGDLGRVRADGELEVLGRRDGLVKVNGARVELGEVEGALRLHEDVRDVVAAAVEHEEGTVLAAYHVGDAAEADLRAHARRLLTPAAVPTVFVPMAEIPRTLNGKADRRRLPRPGAGPVSGSAPRDGLERDIMAIWAELLGLAAIGRDDDFVRLGGDSLATARLLDRLRTRHGVEIPLRTFLSAPTVAGLAATVTALRATVAVGSVSAGNEAAVPGEPAGRTPSEGAAESAPSGSEPVPAVVAAGEGGR